MVFLHTATLRSALEALDAGESVLVCGGRTSGRTTLLKEAGEHYALSGRSPLMLYGTHGLDAPLATLRASDLGAHLPEGQGTAVSTAFAMLVELLEPGDRSVLVDDIDQIDPVSLGLLDQAVRTTGAAVLATAGLGLRTLGSQRSQTFSVATRLDLPTLGFEECAELLREALGGPVETSTIARLMTKTGGVPGLLVALARSAFRSGRLVLRGGLWQGVSELWNPGVRHAVSALLSGLTPADLDALLMLSLAGTVDVALAQQLVDEPVLQRLEGLGCLGLQGTGSDLQPLTVSVQPQIVAEFFRHEAPALQRLTVTAEIRGRLGASFVPVDPVAEPPSVVHDRTTSETISRIPAVTFSVLQERLRSRYLTCHRDWTRRPVPETAIALLDVLVSRGVDRREVLEVLSTTRRRAFDAGLPIEFITWEARWRAWVDQDLPGALETLARARDTAEPAEKVELDVLQAHLTFLSTDDIVLTEGERVPVPDPSRRESTSGCRYDEVLRSVVVGTTSWGLRELERVGQIDDVDEATLNRSLYGELLLLSGAVAEALELSASYREVAIQQVDPFAICLFSHTLAKALIFMGRFREAETVLDDALSIGNPTFPHIPLHVGNLSMLAVLQGRMGRFDLALPTQVRAEAFGITHAFTLLGSPRWSRAYLDALRGERNADQQLWEVGVDLRERGFLASALGVWALGLGTWTPEQLDVAEAADAEFDGDLFGPMLAYQRALVSGDIDTLEEASALLAAEDRPFFAGVALYTASRRTGAEEHPEVVDERRVRAEKFAETVGVDLFDLTPGASLLSAMSPREREIATMVSQRFSNAEIAERLFLSVRTVESHVHRVLRKLDLTSRADLIALWKKY